jgi:hypothetical protein
MSKTKDKINPVFNDFRYSRKQVIFSLYLNEYRRKYNLSLDQMAHVCTLYGKNKNIKFAGNEIYKYERCETVPTMPKFQVLMNTININENMLGE